MQSSIPILGFTFNMNQVMGKLKLVMLKLLSLKIGSINE